MTPAIAAMTQFTIALICGLLFFTAFQKHHHRVFFIMIIPTIANAGNRNFVSVAADAEKARSIVINRNSHALLIAMQAVWCLEFINFYGLFEEFVVYRIDCKFRVFLFYS